MFIKEEAKMEVRKLVEFYNSNKDSFKESSEADIRIKLIDRLFEILGWDVWGRKIGSEVTREETVKMKESKKKKADYAFRMHGIPKFVVEAKAIKNIDLSSDEFREQAVGYAYNLACSWAVLTNFVKTRIYFVDKEDGVVTFNISDISDLGSFDKHFEILWFLSNEAVKDDLLGKYLDDKGIKPQKGSVGKQLYEDLKEWRSILSDEIKSKHGNYEKYVIEEIVQRIIDRLIFIRKVEDMEIEERKLEQLTRRFNEGKTYEQLKIIFRTYRQKYNSGLFGEKEEHECDRISISDKPIETMIRGMYVPKGRRIEYNFSVIDADVLGNIYEQYLAYILHETPKTAKLEGGRSHRKEQGIYYTPIYIVDYIVKNTVSEALKDKTIDEILSAKILDPACGSGSFLIRAFSEVCRIVEDKMKKGDRSKISPSLKDYSGRLTMKQKITILLSCIYGVDLDKKAVEIAQLNLLFKLLEGETAETISQIEGLRKILPTLGANIKHGNSLIDDKKIAGDDAFKWEDGFSDIMSNGGFDIVIGNPPWGASLSKDEKQYFKSRFVSAKGIIDTFALFIERSGELNKEFIGLVLPDIILLKDYPFIRKYILDNFTITNIVYHGMAFQEVNLNSVTLIMKKPKTEKNIINIIIEREDITLKHNKLPQKLFESLEDYKFNIYLTPKLISLKEKLNSKFIPLREIGEAHEGIHSGNIRDKLFVDKKLNEKCYKLIFGRDEINRYFLKWNGRFVNYDKSIIIKGKREYAGLGKEEYFTKSKILIRRTGDTVLAVLDEAGYFVSNNLFVFLLNEKYKKLLELNYITGILNSKLITFFFRMIQPREKQLFAELKINHIEQFPIAVVNKAQQQPLIKLVDKMLSLNKKLNEMKAKTDARAKLEEEIKKTDAEIDGLVYKLYGITEEEKKVIEESLK